MYIRTTDFGDKDHAPNVKIATLNGRSVKNKVQIILKELTNNDINAVLITETWTKDTQEDLAWLTSQNFTKAHMRSQHTTDWGKRGGGIA